MTTKQSVGYHSIVAALTPGSITQPATVRAANVAAKLHSEVTLAHVMTNQQDAATEKQTAEVIARLSRDFSEIVGIKSTQGDWLEIIRLADEVSGDLIVLDQPVYRAIHPLLTIKNQDVCDHGECDALVVNVSDATIDNAPKDYQHIVVAADLNDQGLMTIYKAVRMAKRYQARLTLLNIIEMTGPENKEVEENSKKMRLRGLEAFTAIIEGIKVEKAVVVTKEPIDQAICQFTREQGADLTVIGSHKYKGLCVILGKKAENVTHNSHSDVLIVHE
ncbi:MAG: universal stress protein [Sedimenticola sp.]|nr:universal stress protein [Sedimenticola sp.]